MQARKSQRWSRPDVDLLSRTPGQEDAEQAVGARRRCRPNPNGMASISRLNGRIVDLERFVVRMGIQHIAAILLQLLPVPPQCGYNHS